jgi:hypothetical protein
MSPSTAIWPCPACTELIPASYQSCPYCGVTADWLDLLRALDYAIRRFLLWKLEGSFRAEQYRTIVESCRGQYNRLVRAAQTGQPLPADTGLPPRCLCWSCELTCHPSARYCPDCGAPLDTPEARLLRYHQLLDREVRRQQEAARLTESEARRLLTDAPERLAELRHRLDRARLMVSSR